MILSFFVLWLDGTVPQNLPRLQKSAKKSIKSRHLSLNEGNSSQEMLTVKYREEGSSANKVEEVSASYCARASTTSNCSNEANYVNIKNRSCRCSSTAPSYNERQLNSNSSANTICNTCSTDKRIITSTSTARPTDVDYFTPKENTKEEVIYIVKGEIREKVSTSALESQTQPSSQRQLPSHGVGKVIKATDLLTSSSSSPLSSSFSPKEQQPVKQILEENWTPKLIAKRSQSRTNICKNKGEWDEEVEDDISSNSFDVKRNNITKTIDNSNTSELCEEGETRGDFAKYITQKLKQPSSSSSSCDRNSKLYNPKHSTKIGNGRKYVSFGEDIVVNTNKIRNTIPPLIFNLESKSKFVTNGFKNTENNVYEEKIIQENYIFCDFQDKEAALIDEEGRENVKIQNNCLGHLYSNQETNDRYNMGEDKRNKSINNHLHSGKMANLGGAGEKSDGVAGAANSSINRRASLAKIYTRNRSVASTSSLQNKSILNRNKNFASKSGLDSDGTSLGSGGDSDSSEEIHYGPGFVNKLKSRYLSVALRSSGPGRPSLRRTASLEDFLDKDKDDNQIELRKATVTNLRNGKENKSTKTVPSQRHSYDPSSNGSSNGAYQSNRTRGRPTAKERFSSNMKNKPGRFEAVKRCQSVEVLSVNETKEDRIGKQQFDSKNVKRNSITKPEEEIDDDEPPPLPPKSDVHKPSNNFPPPTPVKPSVDSVLKGPDMANDVSVYDKNGDIVNPEIEPISPTTPTPSSNVLASMRRPFQKRRSSGILFGVEERELPAPDTVRETRKIFESRSSSSLAKKLMGPNGTLTKSRSTSSLYSRELPTSNASNSRFLDKNKSGQLKNSLGSNLNQSNLNKSPIGPIPFRSGISVERRNSNSKSPIRRVSSSPNRNVANSVLPKKVIKQSSQSPSRRNSYVNPSSQKPSLQRNAPKVTNKPTLPSKPAHLSSSLSASVANKASKPSNTVENTAGKKINTTIGNGTNLTRKNSGKSSNISSLKNSNTKSGFEMPVLKPVNNTKNGEKDYQKKFKESGSKSEESNLSTSDKTIKLVPVKPLKSEAMVVSNNGGPDWKAKPSSPPLSAEDIEEGVKLISSDSIRNIRQGGNSFSFNFNGNGLNENIKSYLPDINKKPSVMDSDEDTNEDGDDSTEDKTDFKNNAALSNISRLNTPSSSVASSYCYGLSPTSNAPKQIGVIKPMTREDLIKSEKPKDLDVQTSPSTSPTIELKQKAHNGSCSQNNSNNSTDVLNKMNSTMSQVAAIRAAAAKPTAAGVNEFLSKIPNNEQPTSEEANQRQNYTLSSNYKSDNNLVDSSKYDNQSYLHKETFSASNRESVRDTNREQEEQTMTNHVLMSNSCSSNNLSSSIVKQNNLRSGANSKNESIHHTNNSNMTNNKHSPNDINSSVPSVIKERELSNKNGAFNDLIVSAKPAKVVSMKKCDSLSSSASNSSSSDEDSASERNGSYDFVIAEENRKNGIMSNKDKIEFPAKKYEIINKSEVSKDFISNKETNKSSNVTSKGGNGNDPSYRESWKARNKAEQQNTMVFNFVNTKRDVTHIENDGLDLSKRSTKKKTQIQLSKVRKSIKLYLLKLF